jgi:hypothetical protein
LPCFGTLRNSPLRSHSPLKRQPTEDRCAYDNAFVFVTSVHTKCLLHSHLYQRISRREDGHRRHCASRVLVHLYASTSHSRSSDFPSATRIPARKILTFMKSCILSVLDGLQTKKRGNEGENFHQAEPRSMHPCFPCSLLWPVRLRRLSDISHISTIQTKNAPTSPPSRPSLSTSARKSRFVPPDSMVAT